MILLITGVNLLRYRAALVAVRIVRGVFWLDSITVCAHRAVIQLFAKGFTASVTILLPVRARGMATRTLHLPRTT